MIFVAWAAGLAAIVFLGVARHEWLWRQDHPYAVGVSGVLIALALAGALVAGAVATLAYKLDREEKQRATAFRLRGERRAQDLND